MTLFINTLQITVCMKDIDSLSPPYIRSIICVFILGVARGPKRSFCPAGFSVVLAVRNKLTGVLPSSLSAMEELQNHCNQEARGVTSISIWSFKLGKGPRVKRVFRLPDRQGR